MDLRKEAKGRECQVRIPGVCNKNPETTILAHINRKSLVGSGMGAKPDDRFGSHCCSACHDAIDGRSTVDYTSEELTILEYEGIFRTQNLLLKEGKI